MMYELPPESVDQEPLTPFVEEVLPSDLDESSFSFTESPSFFAPLKKGAASRLDLFQLAHLLHEKYPLGFSWKDYAMMIHISCEYLKNCDEMTLQEKQEAVLATLNYVIAQTDPSLLPEKTCHPLFEKLLLPFIDLGLKLSSSNELIFKGEYERIKETGLSWVDLAELLTLPFLKLAEGDLTDPKIGEMHSFLRIYLETLNPTSLPEDFDKEIVLAFTMNFLTNFL